MMIISFANQKGGVGKTTTAVTLGHALAQRGHRTLIVDTDPQGHVALALGLEKAPGLYNLILDECGLRQAAQTARPNLWIIPGDKRTEKAQRYLASMDFREHVMSRLLDDQYYEYILIDLAPSLGVLHVASLVASDWVVVPTKLDALAVDGVNEILRSYAEIVRQGGTIQGYSIIPTFFDRTTNETREQLKALVKTFGDRVLPPIPCDTRAREAAAYGKTLWEYASTSQAVTGYQTGRGPGRSTQTVGGYAQIVDRLLETWGLQ